MTEGQCGRVGQGVAGKPRVDVAPVELVRVLGETRDRTRSVLVFDFTIILCFQLCLFVFTEYSPK